MAKRNPTRGEYWLGYWDADIISDQAVVIFWGCPDIEPNESTELGIGLSN